MALQVGRDDKLENNKIWLIARVLKSSDLDMSCLHKDFVSEARAEMDVFQDV